MNITPVSASGIFQKQWQRWQDFRKWQNDNRGLDDDDGGFPAYVEWRKYLIQRDHLPRSRMRLLAEIEADPSSLKSGWDLRQSQRERQRHLCREHGCRGFRDYNRAVKRRLARQGFTQPFQLNKDPKKQDQLTTWIEYLNSEYWWLDKYASDIERLEPEHDKLWQELVDENVLRPHETNEFVRTDASSMECERDKGQTRKDVQRAESEAKRIYILTQEDPNRLHIPQRKRISMMNNSRENLLAARQRSEQAQKRSHLIVQFVRATFGYAQAKRDATRHRTLVQWVLDQVPLIESEVKLSKSNGPKSDERGRAKRKRAIDEEAAEGQSPKRTRFDLEVPQVANVQTLSKAIETRAEPKRSVTSSLPLKDTQAILEGPRRSARIAARQDASRDLLKSDMSQSRSLPTSEATSAQARVSRSQTKSQKIHMARRQPQSSSQGGIAKPLQRSQGRQRRRR